MWRKILWRHSFEKQVPKISHSAFIQIFWWNFLLECKERFTLTEFWRDPEVFPHQPTEVLHGGKPSEGIDQSFVWTKGMDNIIFLSDKVHFT